MSKKSNNKTAFFCCGNESYVNVMISQLSLARTYNDVDCYIISNLKNNDKIQLIKNFDINLINVDLSKSFTTTNKHWPIEAFYYFYAPEELYQRGYEKSVFFDGDVYCANKINLDKLDMKGRDISAVRESKKGDFNAGVIVFDNEKLYKKKFFKNACKAYKNLIINSNFNRKQPGGIHDQILLNTMCNEERYKSEQPWPKWAQVEDQFSTFELPAEWNYFFVRGMSEAGEMVDLPYEEVRKKIKFAHFSMTNPWKPYERWGSRNHGMLKTGDFPDGWITKKRNSEPNRNCRIRMINEWRRRVKTLQREKNVILFDNIEPLPLFEGE